MIKRTPFILAVVLTLLASVMVLGWAASPAKKKKGPPPPPPKVFTDGSPWIAVDQKAAMEFAHETPELVVEVMDESPSDRRKRLGDKAQALDEMKRKYLVLDSPLLKQKKSPYGDLYGPVRFMHTKHATVVKDCVQCHHYKPNDDDSPEMVRCSACHQESFNSKVPGRIGLKAAYHQQCMDCHKQMDKGPVGCTDCHAKNVPDHRELVQLPDNPDPITVTRECLRCHNDAAEDMLTSAPLAVAGAIAPHTGCRKTDRPWKSHQHHQ